MVKKNSEEWKALKAQKAREWYAANKERAIKRMMVYNKTYNMSEEQRENQRSRGRAYYHKNKDRCKEYQRKYKEKLNLLRVGKIIYPKIYPCPKCGKMFSNKHYANNGHLEICSEIGE